MPVEHIVAGFVIGFFIGLTGIGGGVLMTPFLILALRLDPVTAIGTDLAFAFVTKSVGAWQHRIQRTVRLRPAFYLSLGSIPAAILSSQFVVNQVRNQQWVRVWLPQALGLALVIVAWLIAARALGWLRPRQNRPGEHWPRKGEFVLLGVPLGILVGLTSVGSGTLLVAILLLFFAVPAEHLVGLNVLMGALLAFFPALTYAYHGFVDWGLLGCLLLGALPGVTLGARMVTRTPTRALRLALSVLVCLAGLRLWLGAG